MCFVDTLCIYEDRYDISTNNVMPFCFFRMPLIYIYIILCCVVEFLTHYQLEHKAVSLQPRGLTNRSNYCYINATLQALIACPPFYNLMKSMPVSPPSKNGKSHTPIIDSM